MLDKFVSRMSYWLKPGVGVKRWCVLLGLGVLFVSIAIAMVIVRYYYLALIRLDIDLAGTVVWTRVVLLLLVGILVIVYALVKVSNEIIGPFAPTGRAVVSVVAERIL